MIVYHVKYTGCCLKNYTNLKGHYAVVKPFQFLKLFKLHKFNLYITLHHIHVKWHLVTLHCHLTSTRKYELTKVTVHLKFCMLVKDSEELSNHINCACNVNLLTKREVFMQDCKMFMFPVLVSSTSRFSGSFV